MTTTFRTIESHTGGNPTRTVLSGVPELYGDTMLARMHDLETRHDWVRTALMFEPRGHSVMSGCIVLPPCDERADVGVLYIEASGHLPMCGHDTIGLVTVLIQHGLVPVTEPTTNVVLDTPAGLVETTATVQDKRVISVTFTSTPSFLYAQDVDIELPGVGTIQIDIAWGGNFYVVVDAESVDLDLAEPRVGRRIMLAETLRDVVNETIAVKHPVLPGVEGVTHVQFIGPPRRTDATNLCSVVIRPGGADRSPCGTGTSARAATLVARGQLQLGDALVHESITGETFTAVPLEHVDVGGLPGVRSRVTGTAYVTGTAEWTIDPHDPLRHGFLVLG
ncbi:proline racemase [Kribbella sp. VKM Ac-2527]|uniref:Proline racemase n=1 Tax=Kribbella caucasensis TaxID=2512215 RepID=A0A4R6KF39_9ACTN|nr:proline racemase family protein [Kribbella sp. VKM Ac-2527]TDO46706.1 proline racemase [Kribbella sp. VKM Ac-2527]